MLKIVFGCALLAVLVNCCRAATAESAQPTEATNTTNSTQLFFNMTEAEVKTEYLRRFRVHCRNATACRNPIVEVINGTLYNMTIQICLWSTPYKNCPYLCVNSKQIECLGKPFDPGCAYECYPKCNGTHPKLSEPYGNYWTICNGTEEEITSVTVQPTTNTKQQSEQATSAVSNPSSSSTPESIIPVPNHENACGANSANSVTGSFSKPAGGQMDIRYQIIIAAFGGIAVFLALEVLLVACSKKVRERLTSFIKYFQHIEAPSTPSSITTSPGLLRQCSRGSCTNPVRSESADTGIDVADSGIELAGLLCNEHRINMEDGEEQVQSDNQTINASGATKIHQARSENVYHRSSSFPKSDE